MSTVSRTRGRSGVQVARTSAVWVTRGLALAAACLLAGCATGRATAPDAPATSAATAAPAQPEIPPAPVYRVGRGDELNFRFFHTPELNTVAVVRPDGRIALPMIGELPVEGMTIETLSATVEKQLAGRVLRPQVVINLQGAASSQRIFVGGEVVRPGAQPLVGALTVLQAVMAAEGAKDTAQLREVIVLHTNGAGQRETHKVDLQAMMEGSRNAPADITLAPHDVIVVPRSGIANVGLWVDQYLRRTLPFSLGVNYTINRYGVTP